MTQPTPRDPHEGINPAGDPESEAVERDQSSYVSRGGNTSGIVDTGPGPGDEQPSQAAGGGTAGGDPLAGVTASRQDVEQAVSGDTGPERPGRQG